MRIIDKTQLLRIMDMQNISDEELMNFTYRLCIDLEMLIITEEDSGIRQWAKEKLVLIRKFFDCSSNYSEEYLDKKIHYSNSCCRDIDDSMNDGSTVVNGEPPKDSIYGRCLAMQKVLRNKCNEQYFSVDEMMSYIKQCEEIVMNDQDNVYYEYLYNEMKKFTLKRCNREYSHLGNMIKGNDARISGLRANIYDLRRE